MAYDDVFAKQQVSGLVGGVSLGGTAADYAAQQADARRNANRHQAFHMAVQANGGNPIDISTLLANADTIVAWLEKPATTVG